MIGDNLNVDLINSIVSKEIANKDFCGRSGTGDYTCNFCKLKNALDKTELGKLFRGTYLVDPELGLAMPGFKIICQVLRIGMKYQAALGDLEKFKDLEEQLNENGSKP
jgi:hypothetical protein